MKFGNGSGSAFRADSGVSNGSRVGLSGTEDLGAGYRVIYKLENGFASNSGGFQQGGLLFGRQAYVGVTSDVGWVVTIGRQNSPLALSLISADANSQIYWGNTQVTGNGVYQSPKATAVDAGYQATSRVDNSMLAAWTTSIVTLRAMVASGDGNGTDSGQLFSGSVTLSTGPLMTTASFIRFRQYAVDLASSHRTAWDTEVMVGGVYDISIAKLFTGYYHFNPSLNDATVTSGKFMSTATYWFGVRIPVFQTDRIIAQVLRTTFDYTNGRGAGTTLGFVYEHPFSKRTVVYAAYGQLNNNSGSAAILWAGTAAVNYPPSRGSSPKAASIGIRHLF